MCYKILAQNPLLWFPIENNSVPVSGLSYTMQSCPGLPLCMSAIQTASLLGTLSKSCHVHRIDHSTRHTSYFTSSQQIDWHKIIATFMLGKRDCKKSKKIVPQ